jgi:transcriptional regulator with XRE-family HTH domain
VDGIGERLKEERLRNGWSQKDLARESKTNVDTISGIETGQHEPRPSTLRKLAKALNIEVRDLFEEPALAGKAEAPQETGQPDEETSAHDIARDEARRQYEIDRKAAARTHSSEGIDHATRISDIYDPTVYDVLRHRPPGELVGTLLDVEQNVVHLEYENAHLQKKVAWLEAENARLREEAGQESMHR